MKYYKTMFDMNAPTKQRVAMLANSDYGVAVSLKKNGQLIELDASDVTLEIDGNTLSADTTDNGMAVFNLSSDFDGGATLTDVKFDKPSTVKTTYSQVLNHTFLPNRITTFTPTLPLSAFWPENTPLKATDIKTKSLNCTTTEDGITSEPFDFTLSSTVQRQAYPSGTILLDRIEDNQHTVYVADGDKWLKTRGGTSIGYVDDVIPYANSTIGFNCQRGLKKSSVWSLSCVVDVDTGDGVKGNFKLELAAEDRGAYFKKDSGGGGGSGGDATLSATTAYTNWVASPTAWVDSIGVVYPINVPEYGEFEADGETKVGWYWENPDDINIDLNSNDPTATSLSIEWEDPDHQMQTFNFNRKAVVEYQLGEQSDKLLADGNTVKSLVAGVVEHFGVWKVYTNDGTEVNGSFVQWQPAGNVWVMYDGDSNSIGEASYGNIKNNLIFSEGNLNYYAYRSHYFTCPNGVVIQAAPSINGFQSNIDDTSIRTLVLLGLFNHYGAKLYNSVD